MSVILTRYLYPKECVMSSLVWAVLDKKSDEALFWAYELYYSGFKIDAFDLLISIHIVFYHEKYPQQTDVLYPLLEKWYHQEKIPHKKFRHHDTILGSVLMNIMYYRDEGAQMTIPDALRPDEVGSPASSPNTTGRSPHVPSAFGSYTCSLSQLMRKRAGVNYLETVVPLTTNMDGFSPIEFTLHDLKPYQTIYTKPPSVILRDACRFPLRTIGCDVCDTNKYATEANVYEMSLRYLKMPRFVMSIQELQDNWLYYASFSHIWSKRIADNHGKIYHEMKSVIFDTEDDEEQFYQEFQYEPDEQSVAVHNSIGIDVSYTTMSWLDFYNKYGKENAVRSVIISRESM